MNPSNTALLGAALLSIAVQAHADEASTQDTRLDKIIVEGSRLNQTESEIGTSVAIITAEDITRLGVRTRRDRQPERWFWRRSQRAHPRRRHRPNACAH